MIVKPQAMIAGERHVAVWLGEKKYVFVLDDDRIGDAVRDGRSAMRQETMFSFLFLIGWFRWYLD